MPDELSTVFSALADPRRRAILAQLMEGDRTVAEINKDLTRIPTRDLGKHLDQHLPR